jgi:hypothetical protein
MSEEKIVLRGIDDAARLLGFFGKKGHLNLVLRVVDVLELIQDDLHWVINVAASYGHRGDTQRLGDGWEKRWLLSKFPSGWVVLPIEQLFASLKFRGLERLQSVIFAYRGIRMAKGEPHRKELCYKCSGAGCRICDGFGEITTYLEMSEEEILLAKKPIVSS